jgi:folate-binding protein YgfZ
MSATLSDLHRSHGAVWEEAAAMPLRYGDPAEEVAALEQGMGVLVWEACGVILLRGPQAGEFLNGVTTNDLKALPVGSLQHHLICANKGKILFEVAVIRTKPEEYLLLTEPGEQQAVAGHLNFYHIREEFQMGQPGLVRLDLIGRGLPALLSGLGIAERSAAGRLGEAPLVTVPDPLGELPRVLALLPVAAAPNLAGRLLAASPPARLIGLEAYEEARIWAGVPRAGVDFTQDFLPAEAALYSHLSFSKGCYVGQEIHARMHHRGHPNRKLVAIDLPELAAAGLAAGSPLFHQGQPAGHMTSLARLSREGRRRGIALVRHAVAQAKAPLALDAESPAVAVLLPLCTDLGVGRR